MFALDFLWLLVIRQPTQNNQDFSPNYYSNQRNLTDEVYVNQFDNALGPGQNDCLSASLVKKNRLTFPPPTTFSAAYTAFPQRGQTSEPPSFCANFDGLGLLVGRWDVCLCDRSGYFNFTLVKTLLVCFQ